MPKSKKGKQSPAGLVKANPVKEVLLFAHETIAGTPVPQVAAFGVIAMAVVSLLAILPLANVELSQAAETPNMAVRSFNSVLSAKTIHSSLTEQILGQQTYQPTVVFSNKQVKVSVIPEAYDSVSGKWGYKVMWWRAPRLQGSIKINGNVFVAKATGSGEQSTGFNLEPNSKYSITFYSKNAGKGLRVVNNRPFTVLAADEQEPVVDVEDPGDTTTDSSKTGTDKTTRPHFEFLTNDLPSATVGVPYTVKISFRYIISTGAANFASNATFRGLPIGIGTGSVSGNNTVMGILPGLEGPNGLASVTIFGTPTATGTFKVNLALTDQYTANADQSFALTVNANTQSGSNSDAKPTYGYGK